MTTEVHATYVGEGRAQVAIDGRLCVMDNSQNTHKPDQALCPVEILAGSVAG